MKKISWRWITIAVAVIVVALTFTGWLLDKEPDTFSVKARVEQDLQQQQLTYVTGYATTTSLINVLETMLNKRGGYLSNDVLPPMIFMDNMPAWEYGVLEMSRDLALVMRNDFSRSQSQSTQNPLLTKAQPALNIDNTSWIAPTAEDEYQSAIEALQEYRLALADPNDYSAQFYSRADNLRSWLAEVEKRLGSLSQRLSASVARVQVNTDLAGDSQAKQSTKSPALSVQQTSWWQIDNVFYESRGAAWALLHFLKGVEIDFADVLEDKNALVSLRQIIRELEATQATVWSPMVLNGSGFGMLANHSLVMANYLSRANAAVIDLRSLLSQG
ncbi:DUF2333 domain-containing protein [Idiomarina tyrosinivorans]|uniref:DUF2333 domain-containing protein n=1 Tax=Idiomarina tyrosinivorans TaxID=1445662 RepID=A0A432ZRW4_9GAMM|nr:DUF2333 family protein [Idiomarina tyrosinivorans]RUO80650.1 DUF2333 domain-containing protein [Idiomarina tyrosinivorans]